VETKTVSEQWILRKLMWDGSPEPPDTETDQAVNGEDVILLIESDEDLKSSVQRYARSAFEARVAELTAENKRLRQGGEAVARRLTAENDKLRRERADVDALLVAAEERLAEVERERDEWKQVAHTCNVNAEKVKADRDSFRAQVEAMRPVVACAETFHDDYEREEVGPPSMVRLWDAVDAYRSATASAKEPEKFVRRDRIPLAEPSRSDDGKADDEDRDRIAKADAVRVERQAEMLLDIASTLPPGPGTVVERVRAVCASLAAYVALSNWARKPGRTVEFAAWRIHAQDKNATPPLLMAAANVEPLARAMGLVAEAKSLVQP